MRILVTTPYFYPHAGGSQKYIEELYGYLMKLDKNVHVDVVTYNTEKVLATENYKGMNVYRVPCVELLRGQFAVPNYLSLIGLLVKLKSRKYDVLNAHSRFFDTSWWGFVAAKYMGARSILTDHSAGHPDHPNFLVKLAAKMVDSVVMRVLPKCYDKVVVVSGATKKFWESVGARDLLIVSNGVNIDSKTSKTRADRGKKTVSFVGRLIESKGILVALEAMKKVLKTNSNVEFVIAGDGPLFKQVRKSKVEGISVLGSISSVEVQKLLSKTDILIHPSLGHEGLPTVILEAGVAGCAVIASDKGGTSEVIEDEVTGLLVDPKVENLTLKIRELLDNEQKRSLMGKSLQVKIQKDYDWNNIARSFLDFLKNQVKEKKGHKYV